MSHLSFSNIRFISYCWACEKLLLFLKIGSGNLWTVTFHICCSCTLYFCYFCSTVSAPSGVGLYQCLKLLKLGIIGTLVIATYTSSSFVQQPDCGMLAQWRDSLCHRRRVFGVACRGRVLCLCVNCAIWVCSRPVGVPVAVWLPFLLLLPC